ncbi:MAG: hypothetical protein J2O46_02930 [Nocardioides sp.]|nr:hypothetical protein [Nocardioides sp.]
MNRPLAITALVPVLALLGACGSSSTSHAAGKPSASPTAAASKYNPCDKLDPAPVAKALGSGLKVNKGTAANPRCALLPTTTGGAAYELNYMQFKGTLDEAWKTMKVDKGTVTSPKIAGADSARLVVQQSDAAYVVTGFVQNGSLIQSFNSVDLKPYDGAAMQRAATALLTELSAEAA